MQLAVGTQLGPYEVIAAVAAGGMGEVYRARDSRLGREVAVKVLPEIFACRPDRLARFEREARAAGALTHPNILSVHDVGTDSGRPYVVFELLDGVTLRTRLQSGEKLTIRKSLEIAAQVAHGLDAAHARGIVHRDLKPENLFLTADGVVKILDFGLAKLEDQPEVPVDSEQTTEGAEPWHTAVGVVLGTAAYMSPEQIRGQAADHRSDLFALGAVLYEMLAVTPAFQKKSRPETLLAILTEDPPDLAQERPGVPQAICSLVRRCLEKDAADRFQSARDLAFAIETLVSGTDSLPARVVLTRRPRWRAVLAVAGLLVLAGAAGRLLQSPSADRDLGTPRQITSDPGSEAEPALSPDGSLVAYTSDRSGNDDIWITDVHGGPSVQLTTDPATDRSPAWLPDGSAVLFESDRGGSSGIWKVPRLGGSAMLIVADAGSPAVSPDGQLLAFRHAPPAGGSRIAVAPLADPSRVRLVTGEKDGIFAHNKPSWSPDGTRICYSDFADLWIVPASGGPARRLTNAHAGDDNPAWSADGRKIVFSSGRDHTLALWAVASSGGEPSRLTLGTGPETHPSLSRDGSRLAFSTSVSAADVAVEALRSREVHHIGGVRDEGSPAFAPDARSLVFVSNREGCDDLWLQALDEGRPVGPIRRLTDVPGTKSHPVFSADGRWLAFSRVLGGQHNIWIMPASGGLANRVTDTPAQDIHPAFSPDGARLAFASTRAGSMNVWTVPIVNGAAAGEPVHITSGSGFEYAPWWSPDGLSIAFTRYEEGSYGIWLVPADGSLPPRRLAGAPEAYMVRWTDAGLFSAARWGADGLTLRLIDPRSGRVKSLDPPLVLGSTIFDISRDGSFVAFDDVPARGNIWILDRGSASKR